LDEPCRLWRRGLVPVLCFGDAYVVVYELYVRREYRHALRPTLTNSGVPGEPFGA